MLTKERRYNSKASGWLSLVPWLIICGAWAMLTEVLDLIPQFIIPPISAVVSAFWLAITEGYQGTSLWMHVFASLQRLALGVCLAILLAVPLGLWMGGNRTARRLSYPVIEFVRGLGRFNIKACSTLTPGLVDAIVVPSNYVKRLVATALTKKSIPIHVVRNAVDTSRFRRVNSPDYSAAAPLGRPRRRVVLWVGRLERNKNWEEMLAIAAALVKLQEPVVFWVVADTNVSTEVVQFRQRVRELGLNQHVRLLPCKPYDSMPHLYNIARYSGGCVLSTSRSEGFQNSWLEGMACGCPVVGSAVGGNLEIISDNVNGRLYQLGNIQDAVESIRSVAGKSGFRLRVVRAALRLIQEKFTPVAHARAYLRAVTRTGARSPSKETDALRLGRRPRRRGRRPYERGRRRSRR